MTKPLLIEIGVEELPAIPLLKILDKIESSWKDILVKYSLKSNFEFLYTPRRLVIRAMEMPARQADSELELIGPPTAVVLKDGVVTPAGVSFATKCGVEFDKLERKEIKGKEVLYYSTISKGKETQALIGEMVSEWISSMAFGKMMRWASRSDEFIRPVRWLLVMLGDEHLDIELFGVKSSNTTRLHRMTKSDIATIEAIEMYEVTLENGGVALNQELRKVSILMDFGQIERKNSVLIERDDELLSEVVAITENPQALLGSFDEKFLTLPPEVIITSMKENQRYFPVFENGKLSNKFVVVSNALTNDYAKVIDGNERVLRPRLSDAMFFYKNDLARGLKCDGLEKVQFIDGLGTLSDKIKREEKIALYLVAKYRDMLEDIHVDENEVKKLMVEAVNLAKADLTSEMVYEFTELQGLMGSYYAKEFGHNQIVCDSIKEQYMPIGDGAELPTSVFSSIVAMSIKLDTLIGLFSVGKIPTGSKDPFSLRRAVNGIFRIVDRYDLAFDIDEIFADLSSYYKPFDLELLSSFVIERLYKAIPVNPSIISAVLSSNERDICEIFKKSLALNSIVTRDDFKETSSTFKRVANISKNIVATTVNSELFGEEAERNLYSRFVEIEKSDFNSYEARLEALFGLKPLLDSYFDSVMVNSDDATIRLNRQATIGAIYNSFKSIADIKEVTV